MRTATEIISLFLIGIGATAILDMWLVLLRRVGVPTLDMALIGRWFGHMRHGTYTHDAIARARPIAGERSLGWLIHYATGIVFAAGLLCSQGEAWRRQPTLMPALAWGLGTVVLPLFVMQPAMGAGVAATKTPTPIRNCLRSLANHTVFGVGLYLSGTVIAQSLP